MCLETLGNTGSVSILCGCVSGSQHVYSPSSSKMLKSLLPSCAFNRRFQKIELTTAPPPFPVTPILSLCRAAIHFWREARTSQNQSSGFKNRSFPTSYGFLYLHVGLGSHSCQSECGMSRKACAPTVGPRQGCGWAGLVARSLSRSLSLSPLKAWGGSRRNKPLLKILSHAVPIPCLVTQPGQSGSASKGGRRNLLAALPSLGVFLVSTGR